MNNITIRAFEPQEWDVFREFRLAALKDAPVFFTSYAEAASWSAERWRDEVKGPGHQVFGLFDGNLLIGITAVFTDRDDPRGQTALLAMSYILPSHRGRGLSRMFYEARLAWVRAQARFQRVVVSHRKSNDASRKANQRYGFVQINVASHTWPDGETEDNVSYELAI
jgi:RimJ/RimL family protein N-acetyltransferase